MTDRQTDLPYKYYYERITGTGEYAKFSDALQVGDSQSIIDFTRGGTIESIANCEELANLMQQRKPNKDGSNRRLALLLGMMDKQCNIHPKDTIPSKNRSNFSQKKYAFFLEAPFEISHMCCNEMKKKPIKSYAHRTHRHPMTAEMASESKLRTQKWLQHGCNGFDLKDPKSTPMSFWTEQDVLLYIKTHNLPICSVYGDVVIDYDGEGNVDGQMDLSELSADLGLFDTGNRPLKTTGCTRTGCVLCGFGCHLNNDDRYIQLKETHPKFYAMLDIAKNNGITMREAIEWSMEHGNLDIRL